MQDIELYISNEAVQLKRGELISYSLQANDIAQLDSIVTNLTTGFKIIPTKDNAALLNYVNQINSSTNLPYVRTDAKLKVNGVWLIQNGYVVIDSSAEDIELTIYANNIDFFAQFDGQLLTDLDYSVYEHEWQQSQVVARLVNTFTNGITYPVIEYGTEPLTNSTLLTESGGTQQDISFMLPAMYVRRALQQAIDTTDYSVKSGSVFWDSTEFKNLILPYTNDKIPNRWKAENSVALVYDNPSPEPPETVTLTYNTLGTYTGGTLASNGFKATAGDIEARCFFTGVVDTSSCSNDIVVSLVLLDSSLVLDSTLATDTVTAGSSAPHPTVNLDSGLVNVPKDYTLAVQFTIQTGDLVTFEADYQFRGGYTYGSDIVPPIETIELFRAVFVQYGIIPEVNPLTKEVDFIKFDTIEDNTAVDWSNKIDLTNSPKIEFRVGNYAQKNYMYYKESEAISEDNTKGSFTISNVNLDNTVDLFTLEFFACNETFGIQQSDIIHLPKFVQDSNSVSQGTEKIDRERIAYLSSTYSSTFTDGFTGSGASYKAAKFSDLKFSNILAGADYDSLTTLLQSAKRLTARFKLEAIDIESLDFFTPVYLNVNAYGISINGLFYIEAVNNYTGNSSTEVILVKF